jgi:hypothetical protein
VKVSHVVQLNEYYIWAASPIPFSLYFTPLGPFVDPFLLVVQASWHNELTRVASRLHRHTLTQFSHYRLTSIVGTIGF